MKIPMQEILRLIDENRDNSTEEWRELLKKGYKSDEHYFEFGIYPKGLTDFNEFIMIINHHQPLYIGKIKNDEGGWLITNSPEPKEGRKHTVYVDDDTFGILLKEANMIYQEYKMNHGGAFFSIPNKWFAETLLLQIIEKEFPLVSNWWGRADWYWP